MIIIHLQMIRFMVLIEEEVSETSITCETINIPHYFYISVKCEVLSHVQFFNGVRYYPIWTKRDAGEFSSLECKHSHLVKYHVCLVVNIRNRVEVIYPYVLIIGMDCWHHNLVQQSWSTTKSVDVFPET